MFCFKKIYNKLNVEVKITWKYCQIWVNPSRLVTVSFTVWKHHKPKQHEEVWLQLTVPHCSLPPRQSKAGTGTGKEHRVKDWSLWMITTYWIVTLHCSPYIPIVPRTTTLGGHHHQWAVPYYINHQSRKHIIELLPDVSGEGIFSVDGPASQVILGCT